jgi:protein SCO1/2
MNFTNMMPRLLFLLLIGLLAGCGKTPTGHFHASAVGDRFAHADFHLIDHTGKPRSLSDFRGKVVLIDFGYTHCPDVCPTMLAGYAQTLRLLGKDADRVQVLFITIDPERDTRELLAKFVPAFDPRFLGLYGDAKATAEAAKDFGVSYQKHLTKDGYSMDHSTFGYLVDTHGKVRLMAGEMEPADWLAHDIRLLLASGY